MKPIKDVPPADTVPPRPIRSRSRVPESLPAPPPPAPDITKHIRETSRPAKLVSDIVRPARVQVPPPATYAAQGEDRALAEEQEVSRLETLMLKGVRDVGTIAKLLAWSRPVTERRIRRVWARWEVTGGGTVLKRARGEAIARTARLVLKLEELLQGTNDNRERIVALKELHTLGAYLDTLRGLTPDAIARLNMVADNNPVAARALKADKELSLLSDLVNRLKAKASGDDTGAGHEADHMTIEGIASRSYEGQGEEG